MEFIERSRRRGNAGDVDPRVGTLKRNQIREWIRYTSAKRFSHSSSLSYCSSSRMILIEHPVSFSSLPASLHLLEPCQTWILQVFIALSRYQTTPRISLDAVRFREISDPARSYRYYFSSSTEQYRLLGSKSQLSIESKLLLYKAILKPIWTYSV